MKGMRVNGSNFISGYNILLINGMLWIGILMAFLSPANAQDNQGEELKVITYNIWNGFDWGENTERNQLFINWVREQSPDVLALQELCGYTPEQLANDARQWGHEYAVILKQEGYPVGITSNQPIEVKEKLLENMWHGMLHVSTYDIDFFVVHLSPSDLNTRMREAAIITERVENINNDKFLVLGDFNAHSPTDIDLDLVDDRLISRYRELNASNEQYDNLRNESIDYSVMARFLGLPAIDLCPYYMGKEDRFSFPSAIKIGENLDDKAQMKAVRRRLDYILASPSLAQWALNADIIHNEKTAAISDHFPVIATFVME